mmetsp:Transcript_11257/g.28340  ORF Transcript_11257/g.28340 Transcript_11257/m.28340 type:complete len:110 (-) Transcript_11257:637-966(-)
MARPGAVFPSLLPSTTEPVWCPVIGMDEEELLSAEEKAFDDLLEGVRKVPAPPPIGVHFNKHEDDDDAIADDDMEEEEEEEEEDDGLDDPSLDDDEEEESDEESGSDAW